jgi:hypothetical protein
VSRIRIVVLESDWSEDGEESELASKARVGPDHSYDRVFADAARLIDGGVETDCAQFVAEQGFRVLLRRYLSLRDSPHLVVGGHGGGWGSLFTAQGSFNVFGAISEELVGASERVREAPRKRDRGLLLASCSLLSGKKQPEALLREGTFNWIAGYRRDISYITGLLTELHFWDVYVNGLSLEANSDNPRKTTRSKTICKKREPMAAALATYVQVAGSFGARFDLRVLWKDRCVSSLEVFQHLALRRELVDEKIDRIILSKDAGAWLDEHQNLARRLERLFFNQWEWNPGT